MDRKSPTHRASRVLDAATRDPVLGVALLAVLGLAAVYASPWAGLWPLDRLADVHADILLLALALVAIVRRYRSAPGATARFWALVGAWLGTWLAGKLFMLVWPGGLAGWTSVSQFTSDVIYLVSYGGLAAALGSSLGISADSLMRTRRQLVELAATILLFAGCTGYLVFTFATGDPVAYAEGSASLLLYAAIDAALCAGYARAALARTPLSRELAWVSLACALLGLLDVWEASLYMGWTEYHGPGIRDVAWVLPQLAIIAGAGSTPFFGYRPSGPIERDKTAETILPLALYPAIVIVLRAAMSAAGIATALDQPGADQALIALTLILGLLALAQQWLLTVELREHRALHAADELRFRQIFEHNIAGMYVSEPSGRLLACNRSFAEIFGFADEEELLRGGAAQIYSDPGARRDFVERLQVEGQLINVAYELRRRNGRPVAVIENTYGEFDEAGRLIEIHGQVIDVTELRRLEDRLRSADKLEALDRLAGGVAHDFNNMLTTVGGFAELIERSPEASAEIAADAGQIRATADRGRQLTDQLLGYARNQHLVPVAIDVVSDIREMESTLRQLLGPTVEMFLTSDVDSAVVEVDSTQFSRILPNLAINARDAMPSGGRWTVHVEAPSDASEPLAGWVRITVSDTGTGMDAATQARIFDPFFTTKVVGEGSGLGLAIVEGVIRGSGGHVECTSEIGSGTTFIIELPRTSGAPEYPPAVEQSDRVAARILVVDDDRATCTMLVRALGQVGFEVAGANDVPEALELWGRAPGFNLLITDIRLPGRDGLSLAEEVRGHAEPVPVIFISGFTSSTIPPGSRFVQKPFRLADLVRVVEETLAA